jgi:hypothetical protein
VPTTEGQVIVELVADRSSTNNLSSDIGGEPRGLDEVAEIEPAPLSFEPFDVIGEGFVVSDEPEVETDLEQLGVRRPVDDLIGQAQRAEAKIHRPIISLASG